MKTAKRIVVSLLSVAALFCFSFAIITGTKAFASAGTTASESDYCVYGGSVKIKDERGAGVKYHVVMTEDYFANYGKIGEDGKGTLNAGVKTGTLLLPYRLTNGLELVVSGTGYGGTVSDSDTGEVWQRVNLGGTYYMQSVVYLYNIPETDYGTEVSVRGYVTSGGENTYTAQKNTISMSYVAKAAYEDKQAEFTEAERTSLKETYLDKTVRYHVDGVVTEEKVDYLNTVIELPEVAKKAADGSEFYGWTTKDGTIVKNVTSSRIKNSEDLYAVYRQKILLSGSSYAISLDNYDYDSVSGIKIGSYDLGADPAALNVSDALKADRQNHGEKEATVTLVKNGESFTVKLPVLLVTKEIASLEDFLSSCRYYGTDIYGYYVLTTDLVGAEATDFGSYERAASCAYRGDKKGFKGTFDGQGHKITWHYKNSRGIFGTLYEATIKNVTLHQSWYGAEWGAAFVAYTAYYSTLENVTITIASGARTETNYAPVMQEMAGCKWKNCSIDSTNTLGILFAEAKKENIDSTYENVTITAKASKFANDIESFDSVTKVKPEAVTLPERQDFVLEGKWDLLDLGEYNGLEIVDVTTEYGDKLNGISPVYAKSVLTDKSKHGEQNFIVTVLKQDGTKVEITVPVTVITKEITTMSDFLAAVKVDSDTESKYGYYVLGKDISHTESGFTWFSGKGNFESGAAFRGVVDGKNHTLTTKSSNTANGLFAALNGANIKNLTIVDDNAASWGNAPAIARNAYGTTFENLTVKILAGTAADGSIDKTQFIGREMKNCVWKNVSIISLIDVVNVFGTLSGNTFENVNIDANITGGFAVSSADFPAGVTVGAKATLTDTYDFALGGENKGITLGEGYEDVTIKSIKYNEEDVTETATDALKAQLGNTVTLKIEATKGGKNITLMVTALVVTEKISAMKQFENAVRYYGTNKDGYFVLANDISVTEAGFAWDKKADSVTYNDTSKGFLGTFDGRNHSITINPNVDELNGGLFGMMGGTFKNTVIEVKNVGQWSKPIVAKVCNGTVENITVNIYDGHGSLYSNNAAAILVESQLMAVASWKDVTVNCDTAINFLFPISNNNKATFKNCVLNAPAYNNINSDKKEVSGWTFVCTDEPQPTDTSARLINLNITDGNVNTTDTYTLNVEGLTETNFVSVGYNGKKFATNGLTFNVSEFGKTYGEGVLNIEYRYKGGVKTHNLPVVLATAVLKTAEDLNSF